MPPDVPYMQPGSWRMSETSNWMADAAWMDLSSLQPRLVEIFAMVLNPFRE